MRHARSSSPSTVHRHPRGGRGRPVAAIALLAVTLVAGGCGAKDRGAANPGGNAPSVAPTTCPPRATPPTTEEDAVSSVVPPSTDPGADTSSRLVGHPTRAGGGSGGGRSGGSGSGAKTGGSKTGGAKSGSKDSGVDDAPDGPTTVPRPTTTLDPCR